MIATIPAKVFNECLEPLRGGREDWFRYLGKRCNLREDTISKALKRESIDFDLCDLILCRLNAVYLWREPPLDRFYQSADIS